MEWTLIGAVVAVVLAHVGHFVHLAWAEHRPFPTFTKDEPFIHPVPECTLNRESSMQNGASEEAGFVPPYMLEGDWRWEGIGLSPPTADVNGAKDPDGFGPGVPSLTVPVKPGMDSYTFVMSDVRGVCKLTYQVTGIANGEKFDIEGPCEVERGKEIVYEMILRTDRTPFQLISITFSELYVRRKSPTGIFALNPFLFQGMMVSGGRIPPENPMPGDVDSISNSGELHLTFLDEGIYEVEVVWKMLGPPDGKSHAEVSRAKFRVDVRAPGDKCKPAAGSSCARYKTVAQELSDPAIRPLGVVRCQPGGGFTAGRGIVSEANILNQIGIYIDNDPTLAGLPSAEKDTLASQLSARVEACVIDHEQEHVRFYSDPFNGVEDVSHACDDCCCDRAPGFANKKVVDCSEAKAWAKSRDCYESLRNGTNDPQEQTILEIARLDAHYTAKDAEKECKKP